MSKPYLLAHHPWHDSPQDCPWCGGTSASEGVRGYSPYVREGMINGALPYLSDQAHGCSRSPSHHPLEAWPCGTTLWTSSYLIVLRPWPSLCRGRLEVPGCCGYFGGEAQGQGLCLLQAEEGVFGEFSSLHPEPPCVYTVLITPRCFSQIFISRNSGRKP